VFGGVTLVIGGLGYARYLPEAGVLEVGYRTAQLLTVQFADGPPETPVPLELQLARLIALIPVASTIVAAFAVLLEGRRQRWCAEHFSYRAVVIGASDTAGKIANDAINHNDDGTPGQAPNGAQGRRHRQRRVVWVSGPAVDLAPVRGVRKIAQGLSRDALRKVIHGAECVVVAGEDDRDTLLRTTQLMDLLRSKDHTPGPLERAVPALQRRRASRSATALDDLVVRVVLRDNDLAAALLPTTLQASEQAPKLEVCSLSGQLVSSMLETRHWSSGGTATPPPVVIGSGPIAKDLLRLLVLGWHRPGELIPVAVVTDDAGWLRPVAGDLRDLAQITHRVAHIEPMTVVAAVHDLLRQWTPTEKQVKRLHIGERHVYLVGLPAILSIRIAEAIHTYLSPGGVTVLAEGHGPAVAKPPKSRVGEVSTPSTIKRVYEGAFTPGVAKGQPDVFQLLADQLTADCERWEAAEPGSVTHPADMRDVAREVPQAVSTAGLTLGGLDGRVILDPGELRVAAAVLAFQLKGITFDDLDPAAGYDVIELVAQLPILLRRIGVGVHRLPNRPALLDDRMIRTMAVLAHEQYRQTSEGISRPGEHLYARSSWDELDPWIQESNRAQVADIPVKLAAHDMTLGPLDGHPIDRSWLSKESIDELAQREHRRWMHQLKLSGYVYGDTTHHGDLRRNEPRTHTQLVPWEKLTDDVQKYDKVAVEGIPDLLAAVGLRVVCGAAAESPGGTVAG
jgi:hypothetical protein